MVDSTDSVKDNSSLGILVTISASSSGFNCSALDSGFRSSFVEGRQGAISSPVTVGTVDETSVSGPPYEEMGTCKIGVFGFGMSNEVTGFWGFGGPYNWLGTCGFGGP